MALRKEKKEYIVQELDRIQIEKEDLLPTEGM